MYASEFREKGQCSTAADYSIITQTYNRGNYVTRKLQFRGSRDGWAMNAATASTCRSAQCRKRKGKVGLANSSRQAAWPWQRDTAARVLLRAPGPTVHAQFTPGHAGDATGQELAKHSVLSAYLHACSDFPSQWPSGR